MRQGISTNPTPPQVPTFNGESYGKMAESIKHLFEWANKLSLWLNQYLTILTNNTSPVVAGSNIASAATIHILYDVHHVTGSATITNVIPPPSFSGGPIWLVQKGTWSLGTGGNIDASATPTSGHAVELIYHPQIKEWHPVGG